jgi:hypothetical protein
MKKHVKIVEPISPEQFVQIKADIRNSMALMMPKEI